MTKILITRFSSFGDIIQALVVLEGLKKRFPDSEIHWVTRSEFKPLIENNPLVDKVFEITKGGKFSDLKQLTKSLKQEHYTHYYDAHNNTRSNYISMAFLWQRLTGKIKFLQRPKNRFKRFLLFKFRINLFPWPFVLMKSYLAPLKKWGVEQSLTENKHLHIAGNIKLKVDELLMDLSSYICFAPSAAWELKRWPMEYWAELVDSLPHENIIFLGGPEDYFIQDIIESTKKERNGRILNLAGKLSLAESCAVIEKAQYLVGGDSGLTHAGDSYKVPTSLIIGAAAFAYPARKSTTIFDHKLPCKPCSKDGRGKCKNQIYKACLYGVKPPDIKAVIEKR